MVQSHKERQKISSLRSVIRESENILSVLQRRREKLLQELDENHLQMMSAGICALANGPSFCFL